MQELIDAIRSLANGKAVGPDGIPVELFKIALNGDPALRQRLLDIVTGIWRGERFRNSGKTPRRRIGQNVETTGVSHWWRTLASYCSRSVLVASVITASVWGSFLKNRVVSDRTALLPT